MANKPLTTKKANDLTRNHWITQILESLKDQDIQQIATNKVAFPTLNEKGEEIFVEITVSIPKGSRDGSEYDFYSMAEEFKGKSGK